MPSITSAPPGGCWRRLAGRPRQVAAVLLLLVGVVAALAATPAPTRAVLVATRDVAAGAVVDAAAVRVAHRPRDDLPRDVLSSPADATGRRVTAAVGAGEVITPARLAPTAFGRAVPAGAVAVAVPVAAGQAALLHAGAVVDLVVAVSSDDGAPAEPRTLARTVPVLAVWDGPDPLRARTVVVAAAVADAPALAVADPSAPLSVVMRLP